MARHPSRYSQTTADDEPQAEPEVDAGETVSETAPDDTGVAQVTDGGQVEGTGVVPLAGVSAASIRITNLYVVQPNSSGAASLSQDVLVSQTIAPVSSLIPVGHSQIFTLSGNTISAITSVASFSGARVTQPVDIG